MIRPLGEASEHPAPEVLAALAAPGSSALERDRLAGHLSRCDRCMGIYAEFVHMHLSRFADAEVAHPPPHLIQLGMAVASPRPASRARGFQLLRLRRLGPALAISTVGLAAVLIWRTAAPTRPPDLSMELRQVLAEQMRHDSQGGLLYSDALMPSDAGIRGPGNADAAQPDLEQLVQRYNRDAPSADVAYWLVSGFLATNQLRNADPYLRESLQRFPSDMRFQNLAAILAYKQDQPAAAESRLRAAVAADRSAVALVNLAIVRRQQGFQGEANALLQEVTTRFAGTAIAAYARSLALEPAH